LHISKWGSQINGSAYIKIIESQAVKVHAEQYCITSWPASQFQYIKICLHCKKTHITIPTRQVICSSPPCLSTSKML